MSAAIVELQAKMRACPPVWLVWVRCDGEESLEAIYDSEEAARIHRDHHNNMRGNGGGYYGRARVTRSAVLTMEIAQRFTK